MNLTGCNPLAAQTLLKTQQPSKLHGIKAYTVSHADENDEKQSNTDILSTYAQAPTDYPQDNYEYADIDADEVYINESAQPGDYHYLHNESIPDEIEKYLSVMMKMINAYGVKIAQLQSHARYSRYISGLAQKIDDMAKQIDSLYKLVLLYHSKCPVSKYISEASFYPHVDGNAVHSRVSNAFISQTEVAKSTQYSLKLDETKSTQESPNEAFVSQTNATTELEASIQVKRLKFNEQNNEAEPTPQFLEASNEVNEPEMNDMESDTDDLKAGLLYSSSIYYGKPPRIDHHPIDSYGRVKTPCEEDQTDEPTTQPTANISGIYGGRDIIAPVNNYNQQNTTVDAFYATYEIGAVSGKVTVLYEDYKCEVELCENNFYFDMGALYIKINAHDTSFLVYCQTPLEFKLRVDYLRKALSGSRRVFELRLREVERNLLADGVEYALRDLQISLQLLENNIYKLIFYYNARNLFYALMREDDAEAFILRACELGAVLI